MKRRDFVKAGLAATGAVLLGGLAEGAESKSTTPDEIQRFIEEHKKNGTSAILAIVTVKTKDGRLSRYMCVQKEGEAEMSKSDIRKMFHDMADHGLCIFNEDLINRF